MFIEDIKYKLFKTKKCTNCNSRISKKDYFCSKCGIRINNKKTKS